MYSTFPNFEFYAHVIINVHQSCVLQFSTVNSMCPKHLLLMRVELIVGEHRTLHFGHILLGMQNVPQTVLRSPISFRWYFCLIPNHCILKKIMFLKKDFNSWYAFKRLRALTNKWSGTSERKWEWRSIWTLLIKIK